MNAPVPMHANAPILYQIDDMARMAEAIAKSGLFGMKDPTQALALMLVAQAEGQHPATIAQEYDLIQGKACRKTHSVLARFQAAGGSVKWEKFQDDAVIGTFSHPQGGSVTIDWTIERARKTMVWDNKKDAYVALADRPMYKNGYPRAMLRARCIAEGIRAVYPAALGGMLVPEEARDPIEKDITTPPSQDPPTVDGPRSKSKPADDGVIQGSATRVDDENTKPDPRPDSRPCQTQGDPPPPDDRPMNEGQLRIIRAKMKGAGLTDVDLSAKFGPINDLKFAQFKAITDWVAERAGA